LALTLIKEDGTGKVDANSYADVTDGDAYHDGHLYASAWTAAATANKEKALVMATRLWVGGPGFVLVRDGVVVLSTAEGCHWQRDDQRGDCGWRPGADGVADDDCRERAVDFGRRGSCGGWFLAHHYGRLRGFVDANQNGVDDRLEHTPMPDKV
jgi:hypothetical protein